MGRPRSSKKPSQGRKEQPLTHFLCLPLVNASSRTQLEDAFRRFRECVSGDAQMRGERSPTRADSNAPLLPAKAIRPVGSLHCTLGVMSLGAEQLREAVCLLQSIDVGTLLREPVLAAESADRTTDDRRASLSAPLQVTLKGLVSMRAPTKTSILFSAPHDRTGRLYNFCLALQKRFKDANMLVKDERPLKLHATVVNTIYAKGQRRRPQQKPARGPSDGPLVEDGPHDSQSAELGGDHDDRSGGHGPNAKAPIQVDATKILADLEDFVWAEDVILDRIALCEMGAKKVLDDEGSVIDEAYTEVASVALPH